MYPCSNPELTAAVSEAGGIGILQPIALTYVHGHEYRAGIRLMRNLTDKPVGMNALITAYTFFVVAVQIRQTFRISSE